MRHKYRLQFGIDILCGAVDGVLNDDGICQRCTDNDYGGNRTLCCNFDMSDVDINELSTMLVNTEW